MTLNSALNTAVSALNAQSTALSVISGNLANSGTTGYKTIDTSFESLVTSTSTSSNTVSSIGGVTTNTSQNLDVQGVISSTSTSTNMAIDGTGFFVVSDGEDSSNIYYTRNGEFEVNDDGYLVLSGTDYYLLGWPTDADGNITAASTNSTATLEAINLESLSSTAAATTEYSLSANLPADAQNTVGTSDVFSGSTTLTVYDSLGTAQYINVTFTPNGDNTWTMTINDPTDSDGNSTGSITGATSYTVTFNSDGTLDTITDGTGTEVTPEIDVTWTDGAADSAITLDLGTSGEADGLTQYTTGDDDLNIDVSSTSQDGVAYGELSAISIDSDGTIYATYTNGEVQAIYKIPIASFANNSALTQMSNGIYQASAASGQVVLNIAGENGAGTIEGGSLEESTVDTTTELSKMIIAQQAYSAASQIIKTDQEMFQSLISAI